MSTKKLYVAQVVRFWRLAPFVIGAIVFLILIKDANYPVGYYDLHNLWSASCFLRINSESFCSSSIIPPNFRLATIVLSKYPPWSVPFIYPLGAFPYEQLYEFWQRCNFIMIALCAVTTAYFWINIVSRLSIIISMCVSHICLYTLYYPIIDLIILGQTAALQLFSFLVAILIVWKTNTRTSYLAAGILLGISFVKPTIIVFPFLALVVASVHKRLLCYVILGTCITLFTGVLFCAIECPLVFRLFLNGSGEDIFRYVQPNMGSILAHSFGSYFGVIPLFIAVVYLWKSKKIFCDDMLVEKLLTILLPIGLLVGPYTNVYDLIFLLPGITISLAVIGNHLSFLSFFAALFAFLGCVFGSHLIISQQHIHEYFWYPFVALFLGLVAQAIPKKSIQAKLNSIN